MVFIPRIWRYKNSRIYTIVVWHTIQTLSNVIDKLQRYIDKVMNEQNNQGLANSEGYTPIEMRHILYDPFGDYSPIRLLKLTDADYKMIPILNQIKYLAKLVDKLVELKLTNKGFLPTKIVSDIYNQRFLKDELIESGISKLYKETDSSTINLTRILLEISGLAKKRYNKLSLTKTGKKLLNDSFKLLLLIFKTFGTKFNWAYYDGYGQNNIGQLGFGFSLILLKKYGDKKQIDKFYSQKYFQAFPDLIDNSPPTLFGDKLERPDKCYSIRTFDRFLDYFGLIEIEKGKKWNADKYITKTELYDKLIKCTPHNT